MKNILLLSTIILVLQVETSTAQIAGYFGKKNFIDVNVGGFAGFGRWIIESGELWEYNEDSDMIERNESYFTPRLNFSIGYSRMINKNSMIGFAYRRTSFLVPNISLHTVYTEFGNFSFRANSPEAIVETFKFVYVFSNYNSLLPIGINHAISAGPRFARINLDREQYYKYYGSWWEPEYPVELIAPAPEGFKNTMRGFEIAYTNTISYPVSKFLILNFGVEMRLAITSGNDLQRFEMKSLFNGYTDYGVSEAFFNEDYSRQIRNLELLNFFNVFVGATIPF
jgi:hypothetical protein